MEGVRSTTRPKAEVAAGPWSRKAFWAILIFAFIVRVVWMLNVNTMPVTDFSWYLERAVSIAQGQGYSVNGEPTAYWPVGYSAFLSAFFFVVKPTITFAKLLNLVLVLVSIGLAFRLAHRLFNSNAVAIVSSLLLSLHFNWIAYSGILASEPLYTVLTLWGTWLLYTGPDQKGKLTWGGFAFGLATLVRPQAALIPAFVLWCTHRYDGDKAFKLGPALWATYVMVALVLVPWTLRNVSIFKSPVVVSTNMGDNLLIGNNPKATGGYMNPRALGLETQSLGEVETNSKATRAAIDYMSAHPWRTVKLWPAKVWNTFGRATDGPYWAFQKTAHHLATPGVGEDKQLYLQSRSYAAATHTALLVLFLVGSVCLFTARRRLEGLMRVPLLGVAMVLYVALVSCVFFGNPRFAFPVIPVMSMYAGALLVMVWCALKQMRPVPEEAPGASEMEDGHSQT